MLSAFSWHILSSKIQASVYWSRLAEFLTGSASVSHLYSYCLLFAYDALEA